MSDEKTRALVRQEEAIDPRRIPHRSRLPDDLTPRRPVEVVTEEEVRHESQASRKASLPSDFFRRAPRVEPPLVPGATVSLESLLGFLAAMEAILPPDSNYPILSSTKIWYEPGGSMLFLEAGSHAVWTVVALKVSSGTNKGFQAMLPVQRATNVLTAIRETYPQITIGVDEYGICLGPHTVPFGGLIDDFPDQPVLGDWVARAAMPAFYFREICSRVLLAKSAEFKDIALQGALLDFEYIEIDGQTKILCTAVATDGARIHILRLPQMVVEVKQSRMRALPPTITVSAGFFYYMRAIIQHEWAAVEFAANQLTARGEDFLVVARASSEGKSMLNELVNWRKMNTEWPGYWLASSVKLGELVKAAGLRGALECRLQVDARNETLTITSMAPAGERFSQSISVRGYDAPALVDVRVSVSFLTDALMACMGGLVRLAFNPDIDDQSSSPVVIRGEDEQFKAIIMPIVS